MTYEIYVFVVVVVLIVLLVFFGISATIPTHRKIQCLTNKDYLLYNILFLKTFEIFFIVVVFVGPSLVSSVVQCRPVLYTLTDDGA